MAKTPRVTGKQLREFSIGTGTGSFELPTFFASGSFQKEFTVEATPLNFTDYKFISQSYTDIAYATELIDVVLGKEFLEELAAAEDITFVIDKVLNDAADASESLAFAIGRIIVDTASAGESLSYSFSKVLSDTSASTENIALLFSKPLADTTTPSDVSTLLFDKAPSDQADLLDDAPVFDISKVLSDTAIAKDLIGIPDGITFQFNMTEGDIVKSSESLVYFLDKTIPADSAQASELLAYS